MLTHAILSLRASGLDRDAGLQYREIVGDLRPRDLYGSSYHLRHPLLLQSSFGF
jgi:hypothetical protein